MASVTEILNNKKEDVRKPPLPPIGHYRLKVYRKYDIRKSSDGRWSFLEIYCQAQAAQEDVDEEDMQEYGRAVDSIRIRNTFIYNTSDDDDAEEANQDTSWRLQEFLDRLGVEAKSDETQLEQLSRAEGLEFIGFVTHKPDKNNPEIVRTQISRTLSLVDMPEYQ